MFEPELIIIVIVDKLSLVWTIVDLINYLWFERRKRNLRLFKFVARPLGGEIFEFYSADNTPDTNTNVKTKKLEH